MDEERLQDLSPKKEYAYLTTEICNTSSKIRKIP